MTKRIVICSDGTWNTPEEKVVTNIVKIARSIRLRDARGREQIVFYDWGVGTSGSERLKGGAFGKGINKNIRDAYRFLIHNYAAGDQIFLFGFSRGAYTVRSLVGLIRNAGLLQKRHSDLIPDAFEHYRSPQKPDVAEARRFREDHAREVKIHFLGVFDTVGALGIPFDLFRRRNNKKYSFHDTRISRIIKHARHALAIDEKRKPFRPTLWTAADSSYDSSQVWFAGDHSDVGGGHQDTGLSDKALLWMAAEARDLGLALNVSYLSSLRTVGSKEPIHNLSGGGMRALGKIEREIGSKSEDESVHASALRRRRTHPGYDPPNLRNYLDRIGVSD